MLYIGRYDENCPNITDKKLYKIVG
jgi:hypothetical protein